MKKVLTIMLAVCMIFSLAACGGNKEPAESKPADTTPTEPAVTEYVLARAKADIKKDLQMTQENMDAWLEEYVTTDAAEAENAIRWDSRKTLVLHKWTKENIAGGTILKQTMFTTTIPDGVLVTDPEEEEVVYKGNYIGVISTDGVTINVSAEEILAALPAGTTGRSIKLNQVSLLVTDEDVSNTNTYVDNLFGDYDLKRDKGQLEFKSDGKSLDLGGLELILGGSPNLIPALMYASYNEKEFKNPVVKITCNIDVDGKQYTVNLGGKFTMTVDPNLDLSDVNMNNILGMMGGGNNQGNNGNDGLLSGGMLSGLLGDLLNGMAGAANGGN